MEGLADENVGTSTHGAMPSLSATALTLCLTAYAGDEVMTVRGETSPEERAWASTSSVTVLDVNDQLPMSTTTGSLVDQAPGVRLQTFGDTDSFSGVSIRGSTLRQVLVYVDGIPLNPDGGQAVNLSEWPLRAFERVEVYRGNTPGRLGGAAVGGAVNLIRDTSTRGYAYSGSASSLGRVSADFLASLRPRIGGHPHAVSSYVNTVVNKGRFSYYSDNGTPYNRIDDQRLTRTHNASGALHALLSWNTRVGQGVLDVVDAWMEKGAELPGHINNPARGARLDTMRNLLGARYTPELSGHSAHIVGWWMARREQYDDRLDELGLGSQFQIQRYESVGLRAHDTFSLTPSVALSTTASIRRDRGAVDTAQGTRLTQTGETVTLEVPSRFSRLDITPVVHGTFLQAEGQATTSSLDPRLGVGLALGKHIRLRGNGGRFLRPPDLSERFGDRGSMLGNPDLTPERGWQWDVGARARLVDTNAMQWKMDVAHFWVSSHGRITWVQNSQMTLRPINLGQTWMQGLEGSLIGRIADIVDVTTNLTLARSRNLDPDPAIANNALPGVAGVNLWHTTALNGFNGTARLTHTIRHVGPSYLDATNWIRSAPRDTQDLTLQVRAKKHWPMVEVGVQNIFDTITEVVPQNPLDDASDRVVQPVTDFAGHPLPGRVWTVSIRWAGATT